MNDFDNITIYNENGSRVLDEELRFDQYDTAIELAYDIKANPDISVREALMQSGWIPATSNDRYKAYI